MGTENSRCATRRYFRARFWTLISLGRPRVATSRMFSRQFSPGTFRQAVIRTAASLLNKLRANCSVLKILLIQTVRPMFLFSAGPHQAVFFPFKHIVHRGVKQVFACAR